MLRRRRRSALQARLLFANAALGHQRSYAYLGPRNVPPVAVAISAVACVGRRVDLSCLAPALLDDAFLRALVAVPRIADNLQELFLPAGARTPLVLS